MKNRLIPLILAALMALTFTPAQAQVPDLDELVQLKVLPGWRLSNGNHMMGVQFTLAPGWKTYWRNPGDAGIPAEFNLTRSKNLSDFTMYWPVPKIYNDYGVRTIGYKGSVIFPLELAPRKSSAPINVRGSVNLGVCAEVCIPVDLNFTVSLPVDATTPDPQIGAALANQPAIAGNNFKCDARPSKTGIILNTSLRQPKLGEDEVLVIEVEGTDLWVAETTLLRKRAVVSGKTKIINVAGNGISFARDSVRLTLLSNGGAVQALGCAKG